jgi:hypothetical protein
MNVSTSNGNNTKYDAGLMRRRYVSTTGTSKASSTGKGKAASTSTGEAETEEASDEERALRDFRLSDEAEK